MKIRLLSIPALACAFAFSGCSTTSTAVSSILTPANIASATQQGVQAATSLFLAKNPSYAPEVQAAADLFTALASSNPTSITANDIAATLAKSKLSATAQAQVSAVATVALSIFETSFAKNLPTLAPNYAAFANAVAAGLNAGIPKAS